MTKTKVVLINLKIYKLCLRQGRNAVIGNWYAEHLENGTHSEKITGVQKLSGKFFSGVEVV